MIDPPNRSMVSQAGGTFKDNSTPNQTLNATDTELRAEVSGLRAARMAYASEFAPDPDGLPDVGNIHANIRALKAHVRDLEKTLLLTRFATGAPADAKREVLPLFSGAIYDFAGFLTTRDRTIEVGSAANASHIIELIKEWSTLRGLDMSTADIDAWIDLLAVVRQDTPSGLSV